MVLIFGSRFTIWSTLVTTFAVGFAYQSSKVCMDSVVQADSDDAYVGRVFALYDTANNLSYVLAFCLGVLIVPPQGNGLGAVVLVAAVFLVTGWGYGAAMRRLMRRPGRAVTVVAHAEPGGPVELEDHTSAGPGNRPEA
jgi:hypothetical protein